jgi:hypothetical protein
VAAEKPKMWPPLCQHLAKRQGSGLYPQVMAPHLTPRPSLSIRGRSNWSLKSFNDDIVAYKSPFRQVACSEPCFLCRRDISAPIHKPPLVLTKAAQERTSLGYNAPSSHEANGSKSRPMCSGAFPNRIRRW